ncbi:acyltransferase [Gardnerella vaginalis]|uniref:acyltransferase family protein n=1 Tax=Gardnerella vaginalis TaxID=2702 RepID=UPI000E3B2516|nr:acyltransferase [Gardnerella vaginalis]RDW97004.1 acyltransferase [Gardnerella vaginalis]
MSDISADTSLSNRARVRKPRLFYLDWIRAIAAILIVVTHFNNPYLESTRFFVNRPFGIYIGGLGVSLFLIISGAALMYNYGDRESLDLRTFYTKRAKTLYPMFWVAFVVANILLFIRNNGYIFVPRHKITAIFSLFGMDGYAAAFGVGTFYVLGEWFLGFIILFYIVFPLLRVGVNKMPIATLCIVLALYAATVAFFTFYQIPRVPSDILLTTRLPELVFGMIFVKFIKKVPHWLAAISFVILAAQQLTHILKDNIAVTVVGIFAFLLLSYIGELVKSFKPLSACTKFISAYSYPIFLVHHVLIMQVFTVIYPVWLNRWQAYGLLIAEFVVILVLSVILKRFTNLIVGFVSKCCAKSSSKNSVESAVINRSDNNSTNRSLD